ncbi:hypothetical protein [Burkholderia cepacia]|uniref:hypothetical protein n=1 Tax=Burkholderia cepacia TaxID=292 RepID=UPI001FC84067|nr:hypothetical protein [Burkholderia cepacia]
MNPTRASSRFFVADLMRNDRCVYGVGRSNTSRISSPKAALAAPAVSFNAFEIANGNCRCT